MRKRSENFTQNEFGMCSVNMTDQKYHTPHDVMGWVLHSIDTPRLSCENFIMTCPCNVNPLYIVNCDLQGCTYFFLIIV